MNKTKHFFLYFLLITLLMVPTSPDRRVNAADPSIPTASTYSVTFCTDKDTTFSVLKDIAYGDTISLPGKPTKEGFWFRGWFLDDQFQNEFNTTMQIKKDTTLFAKWEEKENKEKDIMSVTLSYGTFSSKLTTNLTNQKVGAHTHPNVKTLSNESIATAISTITLSKNINVFAFQFDMEDFTYNPSKPLPVTITIPQGFDSNKLRVYFSPNGTTIQGTCVGQAPDASSYQIQIFESGTYIILQDNGPTTDATSTITPPTPMVTMCMDESVLVDAQTSAILSFKNFPTDSNPSAIPFTWTSSNPKIATVDNEGIVTGINKGTTTITATSSDGTYTATANITVVAKKVPVKSLLLKKNAYTIKVGKSFKIATTILPTNATNKTLQFSSNKPKVVAIVSGNKIKAKKKGKATITIKTTDGSNLVKKIKITVK